MGLFYNYRKTGSGIEKDTPEKGRIVVFFEILLRKFWKLIEVNLLYFVFFIPLVLGYYAFFYVSNFAVKMIMTAICIIVFAIVFGPATAGVFKIMRSYAIEKHSFIISDFKKAFTQNFKKSLAMGLIDIVVFISVCSAIYIYPKMAATYDNELIYVPLVLSISLGIAVTMVSFYAYLLVVATDVSFKNVIRNSIVLSCVAIKKNLITLVITLVIAGVFAALTIYNLFTVFAFPFVPAAIIMFVISFNSYPVIQKYVINPYYEQRGEVNPELSDAAEEEEVLFEDMGGKEKPMEQPKTKGGRKTVS